MAMSSLISRRCAAVQRPFVAAAPRPSVVAAASPSPLQQAPPSTYAVVEVAGTQLFVESGKWYTVNRLKADVGARIRLARVLAVKHEGKLQVGQPFLEKANVEAEVIEELRGPKVLVYKMRPKKHYRRKRGHR